MFKPGVSGNPGGRHKVPVELRGINAVSPAEVRLVISKFMRMGFPALREAINGNQLSALDAAIANQAMKAACGSEKSLLLLFERLLGRPDQMVQIESGKIELESMSTAELLDVVRKSLPAARDLPGALPDVLESVGESDGKEQQVHVEKDDPGSVG